MTRTWVGKETEQPMELQCSVSDCAVKLRRLESHPLLQLAKLAVAVKLRLLPGKRKVADRLNLRKRLPNRLHLLLQGRMAIANALPPSSGQHGLYRRPSRSSLLPSPAEFEPRCSLSQRRWHRPLGAIRCVPGNRSQGWRRESKPCAPTVWLPSGKNTAPAFRPSCLNRRNR